MVNKFFVCSLVGEHVWNLPNERRSGGQCMDNFINTWNLHTVVQWLGRCAAIKTESLRKVRHFYCLSEQGMVLASESYHRGSNVLSFRSPVVNVERVK